MSKILSVEIKNTNLTNYYFDESQILVYLIDVVQDSAQSFLAQSVDNEKRIAIQKLSNQIDLICIQDGKQTEIDSRTSDALALAVRFGCPIYTFEFILEQAGIILEEETEREVQKAKNRRADRQTHRQPHPGRQTRAPLATPRSRR